MKKVMLKTASITCFIAGVSLLIMPARAAWHDCLTDGGYFGVNYGCEAIDACDQTYPYTPTTCHYAKWQKGWYCGLGGNGTQCENIDPTQTQVYRRDSVCTYTGAMSGDPTNVSCICSLSQASGWYATPGDTKDQGQCQRL